MLRRITVTALMLLLLSGMRPGTSPVSAAGELSWRRCGNFQCATLSVPLGYDAPNGRQIVLALARQPARDPDHRIGSLLVNPGGPGASGVDFLGAWAPSLPNEIKDRFDIVSFDPRGVGGNPSLHCGADLQKIGALDPSPTTAAQWQQAEATYHAFATQCGTNGGDLLPYLGTVNVVRDLDRIRAALGDDKLSYVGYSYGTQIGEVYADLFPDRVRALVLDGVVDYSISPDEQALQQALGFEQALDHYLTYCRENHCLTAEGFSDPGQIVDEVLARAEVSPIPAPRADRPAGPGEATFGMLLTLYSRDSWSALTLAMQRAIDGDGSSLVRLADSYLERQPDGSYGNLMDVNAAVNCLDAKSSRDPQHFIDLTRDYVAKSPHFGGLVAESGLLCAYWPVDPRPLSPPHGRGAPPILLIGTTGDPATPYQWAVNVRHQLQSAVLLTNHGEGHTSFGSGSSCVSDIVERYLLTTEAPAGDVSCGEPLPGEPALVSTPRAGGGVGLEIGLIAVGGSIVGILLLLRLRTRHPVG